MEHRHALELKELEQRDVAEEAARLKLEQLAAADVKVSFLSSHTSSRWGP